MLNNWQHPTSPGLDDENSRMNEFWDGDGATAGNYGIGGAWVGCRMKLARDGLL